VFAGSTRVVVYYFPGGANWEPTLGERPTALWNPDMPTLDPAFGINEGAFRFNITGSSNLLLVIEASLSVSGGPWVPLATNTLVNGSSLFADPNWTNSPGRFYRVRSP
jgi:hypothetical protein